MGLFGWLEFIVFTLLAIILWNIWHTQGLRGLVAALLKTFKVGIPGFEHLLHRVLSKEVKQFTKQASATKTGGLKPPKVKIPEKGIPTKELLDEMSQLKAQEINPKDGIPTKELLDEMSKLKSQEINPEDGKIFAYVYTAEGDTFEAQKKAFDMFTEKTGLNAEHEKLVRQFHHAFMHENALNPMIFPSLRRFENEVISMSAAMLNGDDDVVGTLTSGGTESILMAMKAYRDRARKLFPHIKNPQMVAPITIHPAHEKAANYFGFEIIHVPVRKDFRPDLDDYEAAITPNTICLLCSAPQYCHGIVDPIPQLSELAVRRSLPLHVDACFGGFMLPWVEKLGHDVPIFDFRLPGVTTITADIHKYGFGAKGASVVLYRDVDYRKYQIFAYSQWPGGLFGSPSMAGTRPGGNIAASWVTLKSIGEDGYLKTAEKLLDTTKRIKDGIDQIPGLCIMGKPHMTAFAIGSEDPDIDILVVADVLEERGWKPERQQNPACLHCTIMPHHNNVVDNLLTDLREAANCVKHTGGKDTKGAAAMYGMVAKIPDKSIIDDFIVEFFSEVYKT